MTIAVDMGRKATKQTNKQKLASAQYTVPKSNSDDRTLSSTGSILSNTNLSDLSTVGTCDIFVNQMRHRVM